MPSDAGNIVENYGWGSEVGPCSCDYLVPVIGEVLKRLNVRRVADLGCGNGALCGELQKNGYEVVGIENDASGVEIARSAYPGINFYRFGVEDDPSELLATEEKFEAVVSTEVIEHLYGPHMLVQYAHAVLQPKGHLIITTPYHGYWKNLALSIMDKWDFHHGPLWHGGHIKFWSRRTLTEILQSNGFEIVDFIGVGRFPYLWKSMLMVARMAEPGHKV
jgi:2-polyprenyl-3-methyl-5-hydroxy-6-metoxy-1,4-benzoquinol methylase